MDKERKGRMKAEQCLSRSGSFMERHLWGLKISYEIALEGHSNYPIFYLLPGDTFAKLLPQS